MADNPRTLNQFITLLKTHGLEYFGVYYSSYRGFIVDNKDPKKLGRLKVRVPQLTQDQAIERWAFPKGQPAGKNFGDFMIPPKGSNVWVEFENGDPNFPVWLGGHWSDKNGETPDEGKKSDPKNRVRKTEKYMLEMDDEGGKMRMSNIEHGDKVELQGRNFNTDVGGNADHKVAGSSSHNIGGSLSESVSGSSTRSATSSTETYSGGKSTTCSTLGLTAASALLTIGGHAMTWDSSGMSFGIGSHTIEIRADGVYIEGRRFLDHTHDGVIVGGGTSGGVV